MGQQHHAGVGSIFGFQLCAAQLITVRSIQFHGDRHAAHDLYVQKVVGVAGRGNQHFIALTHKRQDRKVQAGVRTGRDQDVALRIHSQTVLLLQLFGQCGFQCRVADRRGVVRCALGAHCVQPGSCYRFRQRTIRHKGIRPAHQGNTLLFQILICTAHIGLFHGLKQAAVCIAERGDHLFFYRLHSLLL